MNRVLGFLIVSLLFFTLFSTTQASAVRIDDNYWGADDNGLEDVIGDPNVFGIDWMDVSISNDKMNVKIKTNYPGFDTLDAGTKYGDFFISSNGWNPDDSQPHYLNDNWDSVDREIWEYAFDVQTGKLYDIRLTQNNIVLSDDLMDSSRYIFRNGQEVAIDPIVNSITGEELPFLSQNQAGSYDGTFYSFTIDISGLDWKLSNLGFHWAAATCGNDVIEGSAPVPEPATMMLLGSGMIGLAAFGRRKLLRKP